MESTIWPSMASMSLVIIGGSAWVLPSSSRWATAARRTACSASPAATAISAARQRVIGPVIGDPSRIADRIASAIALEIEFLAFLVEKLAALRDREDRESQEHELVCREALAGFVRDHVVWWMPTFGRCLERRVDQLATDPAGDERDDDVQLLGSVGRLLCAWVAAERTSNRVEPYRRIVGPQVAPQETSESSCGSCTTCLKPAGPTDRRGMCSKRGEIPIAGSGSPGQPDDKSMMSHSDPPPGKEAT